MPLQLNLTEDSGTRLWTWMASESTDQLMQLASNLEIRVPESANTYLEKRKREWITTRLLLLQNEPQSTLHFRESGQPYLKDGRCISISHSDDMASIVINHRPVGIDIQAPDPKIYRIRKRFCHEKELHEASKSPDELDYLTTLWSAKEAVFKCFGIHVHFSSDILLRPFSPNDTTLIADYSGIHGKHVFHLRRRRESDYIIIYTL